MKSLTKKLADIMGEIKHLEKQGHNKEQGYEYFSEAQLSAMLREKLSKRGIFVFTSTLSQKAENGVNNKGNQFRIVSVETEHEFIDSESGESVKVRSCGEGKDFGDKAIYKAITGATKYALMKCFLISDGADPENDDNEVDYVSKPIPKQESRPVVKQSAPAPKPEPRNIPAVTENYLDEQDPFLDPRKALTGKEIERIGIIEEVKLVTGTSKGGKPYTIYKIELNVGEQDNIVIDTFSDTFGQKAVNNKGQEATVFFNEKQNGKFTNRDLVLIEIQDEIPF